MDIPQVSCRKQQVSWTKSQLCTQLHARSQSLQQETLGDTSFKNPHFYSHLST